MKYKDHTSNFEDTGTLQKFSNNCCFELDGDRGTSLGTNMQVLTILYKLYKGENLHKSLKRKNKCGIYMHFCLFKKIQREKSNKFIK